MLRTGLIFYGRERRQVYWSATLTNLGLSLICILLFGSIKTLTWIAYIYFLVTIVPQTAITVRRLHDVSYSGKKLFFLLVPIVGVVFIFIDLTLDSTPDINMYGDSLKYPHVKKFTLSPEDIAIPKKSKETTPPPDDTDTDTEPKESTEAIETEQNPESEDTM
jgi:uncharacterized membrane protein YhaH (DUF805 family)